MVNGKGSVIFGRRCRTEMVKQNSKIPPAHSIGSVVGGERLTLSQRASSCRSATRAVSRSRRPGSAGSLRRNQQSAPFWTPTFELGVVCPPSVVVEFQHFDPHRDVPAMVSTGSCSCSVLDVTPAHPLQCLQSQPDLKVEHFDKRAAAQQPPPIGADVSFLEQYEVDRRSIWVGGFAPDLTRAQLQETFSKAGSIKNIELHKREEGT